MISSGQKLCASKVDLQICKIAAEITATSELSSRTPLLQKFLEMTRISMKKGRRVKVKVRVKSSESICWQWLRKKNVSFQ